MCLDMVFDICFLYIFFAILLYVHMYMDINTTMSYVIKLHYVVWVSCHYDNVVMLLCYHDVMMSCGLALSKMIIVNTVICYVIKL